MHVADGAECMVSEGAPIPYRTKVLTCVVAITFASELDASSLRPPCLIRNCMRRSAFRSSCSPSSIVGLFGDYCHHVSEHQLL